MDADVRTDVPTDGHFRPPLMLLGQLEGDDLKKTNKRSKLSIPHTTVWWDNDVKCSFSRRPQQTSAKIICKWRWCKWTVTQLRETYLNESVHRGVCRPICNEELHVLVLNLCRFRLPNLHRIWRRHCFGCKSNCNTSRQSQNTTDGGDAQMWRRTNKLEALSGELSTPSGNTRQIHEDSRAAKCLSVSSVSRNKPPDNTYRHRMIPHLHLPSLWLHDPSHRWITAQTRDRRARLDSGVGRQRAWTACNRAARRKDVQPH